MPQCIGITDSSVDDASVVPDLLEQVDTPIERFTGDGAYDSAAVYERVGKAGTPDVAVVVPPRRPARASEGAEGMWAQRNDHLRRIDEVGRQAWLKESGYRKQAGAENFFFRYKRILGDRLRARGFEAQKRAAMVGWNVLNRMYELGKPESYAGELQAKCGSEPIHATTPLYTSLARLLRQHLRAEQRHMFAMGN